MSTVELFQHRFRSMGSEVEVLLFGSPQTDLAADFARTEAMAAEWMQTFNRFDPDSELSQLNDRGSGRVSPLLFDAIRRAVDASRVSRGTFNPLVLPQLLAAGYDRSLDSLRSEILTRFEREIVDSVDEIILDARSRRVELPERGALDLGGIVKGLFADKLMKHLAHWRGGIVSAGGDMRAWGEGPDQGLWAIGVEHPARRDEDLAVVALQAGGVATSGVNRRTWRNGTTILHHLIDPMRGRPASTDLASITVIAPNATVAEIASTALFVDPGLAANEVFRQQLWAMVAVDSRGWPTLTRFDLEGSFYVYLNTH